MSISVCRLYFFTNTNMTLIAYSKEPNQSGVMYSDSLVLTKHSDHTPTIVSFRNKLMVDKSEYFCFASTGVLPIGHYKDLIFNDIRSALFTHYAAGKEALPLMFLSKNISSSTYVKSSIVMTRDKAFYWSDIDSQYMLLDDESEHVMALGSGGTYYHTLRALGYDNDKAFSMVLDFDRYTGGKIHKVSQDDLKKIVIRKPKKEVK